MFKIFLKVMLVASLLVAQRSENTFNNNQSAIVTCSGTCGVDTKLPCSCHAKCFIYKNCCENITVDCPELLDESRSRYGASLNAEVFCSTSGTWMISSCPRRVEKRSAVSFEVNKFTDEISRGVDGKKLQLRQNVIKPGSENLKVVYKQLYSRKMITKDSQSHYSDGSTKRRLKRSGCCSASLAFKNAHVWDRSTGLSYVNSSTFKCNGGKASNMVRFDVTFAVQGIRPNETKNRALAEIAQSFTGDIMYEPSFSSDSEAWSPCLRTIKGSGDCKQKILNERPELLELCEGFISPIETFKGNFRNRFCYFCFTKNLKRFVPIFDIDEHKRKPTGFKLSVTFSLTESNVFQVKLRSEDLQEIKWSDATCISNLFLQSRNSNSNLTCNLQRCPPNSEIRSDGECKTSHNTFIGFSDNNLPRTDKDENSVSRFLGCGMKKYLGIEVVEVSPSMIIQHNSFFNKTIYVSNMSTFLTVDYPLSPTHSIFRNTVLKLLNLSQALSEYLKPRNESFYHVVWGQKTSLGILPEKLPRTIKRNKLFQETISSRTPKNSKTFLFDNVQDEVSSLSRNVSANFPDDNNVTTVVCFASAPVTSGPVNVLNCLQGHSSESDLALAFEIVNSSCFSVVSDLGNQANVEASSIFIPFCFFLINTYY